MASAYVVTLDHVESPSLPNVTASAMYGDNGPDNGPDPEFTLVSASTSDYGRTVWNADYAEDGSWDSGTVPVSMTLAPDGLGDDVITWTVNGETALTQTVASIGTLAGVEVVAGTQINGSAQWSDMAVTFSDGTTDDAYTASGSGNPSVDTTTADNPAGESEAWVTPAATTDTSVTVTGNVRFTLPPDTYPNPDDLFADIYVYA